MKSISRALIPAAILCFQASSATSIWMEGEAARENTMKRSPWWYDKVKKDLLSGGDWLSNFGDKEATASYVIPVPADGTYTLWLRANPVQSKMDYAFGDGAWTPVDFTDKRGQQNIAEDNKPDLRFIAWVKVGAVPLKKGDVTFKIRMNSQNSNHGALDCFLLTDEPFIPQGATKPAPAAAAGPADWFPLMADNDTFSPSSVIDMSALNHAPAGKYGPVLAAGKDLRFANSTQPVRFWGAGANLSAGSRTREEQIQRIKYLRKYGINYVRQHPLLDDIMTGGRVDPAKLAEYDWWFAELKKAGIYSCWSIFYHFPIKAEDGYPAELFAELPEIGKGTGLRDTYGIIQMSPELWKIRMKTMLALLNHKNPFTGLRYAEDPALATVEFQNEDCIFFWNPLGELTNPASKKVPLHAKLLRTKFAAWVKKQYGTDEAVKKAWGKFEGESLATGELQLLTAWDMDASGIRGKFAGQNKRAGDQIRFLTEMQNELYDMTEKEVRATGFKAQTVTTNWLGANSLIDQPNIYTDTTGSMIDRHNYAGGGVGGHGITEGAIYADSHLGRPGGYLFGIGFKQVENKPFSLSEWTMCPPNQWKAEAAPICAFYGMGLQGWDASCHFVQNGTRMGDGWPGMASYSTDTPHYIGQFPALAFAIQKGHIKESPVIAARRTTPEVLYSAKQGWSQNYYDGTKFITAPDGTPEEVFAMGRVTVGFDGGKSEQADLGKLWNKEAKVITSVTGELVWDYGNQNILVKSPKTQAIIGRAAGKPVELPGVSVELTTEFVSLIFTPLDDAPLADSRHILITAEARDKQTGAAYSADGKKLESVGGAPLLLEPVQAKLRLKGSKPVTVLALDHEGVPKKDPVKVEADGSFHIDGTHRAFYYEVRR